MSSISVPSNPSSADTVAAIATAPGRGGVAVVRVSGPAAFAIARRVTNRAIARADAGRFFHARFADVDDGLVLVFAAPHSYTGEDVVELQGHGGSVAPRRVLEACLAAGARLARRGEFTRRAFLNGRLDLSESEAVLDLIDASTARAADDALARLSGGLSRPFESLYLDLVDLSSRVEHALDFDEGELPSAFEENLHRSVTAMRRRIIALVSTAREGRMLREGALVVLAGAPNAGKSSLMNALLGEERVIVSATAGTTRDVVEEGLEIDGWPVRLADTAGLRETADAIEAEGVERARRLLADADVVLALDCDWTGAIKVHAKCDLDTPRAEVRDGTLAVSAKTGTGIAELKKAIAARLAVLAAKSDEAVAADITTRQRDCLEASLRALEDLPPGDLVLTANALARAAAEVGRMLGKTYSEDLLDALFSRFCVGK